MIVYKKRCSKSLGSKLTRERCETGVEVEHKERDDTLIYKNNTLKYTLTTTAGWSQPCPQEVIQ